MKPSNVSLLVIIGLIVSLMVSGCDGGGSSSTVTTTTVRIEGVVDDGTLTSPVANAICRYVIGNVELATITADANGVFSLQAAPNMRGFIECHPPGLPNLKLSTFVSTMGLQAGKTVSNQNVTPAAHIIARIIAATNPETPEAEEAQLIADLAANTPEIALLRDAAVSLYNALLNARINTDFQAALNDLLVDGSLELPALQPVAAPLGQAVAQAEQQHGVRIAAATIGLLRTNVAPTATADAANTPRNTPVIIRVLNNDFDDNIDALVITSVTQGTRGTVGITDSNTTVTYTPGLDVAGTDTFTYTIRDPAGLMDTATVTVGVGDAAPVNRRPVVANRIADVQARSSEPNRRLNLAGTFSDLDGEVLTLAVVANTDTSVVLATVTGTTLTLDFQNTEGTARITVRAADRRGGIVETDFTVTGTLVPAPLVRRPADQQHMIGQDVQPFEITADGCAGGCTFTASNLPPDLQIDQATGRITGTIALTAFSRGPLYLVEARATDASEVASGPVHFTWRVTQGVITEQATASGEAGDGDGDGDRSDGDGGAEGNASDGGNLSPLTGAKCRLVDLNGVPVADAAGNVIETNADANGKFLLRIPANPDPNKPDFVTELEGFIECFDPQKNRLVVSTYLNTKGLRRGERLSGLTVNPATTVVRQIHDGLNTAAATTASQPDLVAIQARFLNGIAGLTTQSPTAVTAEEVDDQCCTNPDLPDCSDPAPEDPLTTTTVVLDINIPLQDQPPDNNSGMTAYIASQLFLAALKGEAAAPAVPFPGVGCEETVPEEPSATEFRTVLNRYFANRTVTSQELIDLGLKKDEALVTGSKTGDCG